MYLQESKQIISKTLSKLKDKDFKNKIKSTVKNKTVQIVKNPSESNFATKNYVKKLKKMKEECVNLECEEKIDKKIKLLNIAINSGRVLNASKKLFMGF